MHPKTLPEYLASVRTKVRELRATDPKWRFPTLPWSIDTGERLVEPMEASWATKLAPILFVAGVVGCFFATGRLWVLSAFAAGTFLVKFVVPTLRDWPHIRQWRREAQVHLATVVLRNDALDHDGPEELLAGALLVTFDPALENDPQELQRIAREVYSICVTAKTELPAWAHGLHDRMQAGVDGEDRPERFSLPRELTGGQPALVVSACFPRKDLPGRVCNQQFLFVAARPCHAESVALLPLSLWHSPELFSLLRDAHTDAPAVAAALEPVETTG